MTEPPVIVFIAGQSHVNQKYHDSVDCPKLIGTKMAVLRDGAYGARNAKFTQCHHCKVRAAPVGTYRCQARLIQMPCWSLRGHKNAHYALLRVAGRPPRSYVFRWESNDAVPISTSPTAGSGTPVREAYSSTA